MKGACSRIEGLSVTTYSSVFSIRIGMVCFERKPSPTILTHSFWRCLISKFSFGVKSLFLLFDLALLRELFTSSIFDTSFKSIPDGQGK